MLFVSLYILIKIGQVVDKESHQGVNRKQIKTMEKNRIELNSHKKQQQINLPNFIKDN